MTATEPATDTAVEQTTVTLDRAHLAYAWETVTQACDDVWPPALTGVSVEVHQPDTVRLTATDTYRLITCVVGTAIDVDDLDATPTGTWIVDPVRPASVPFLRSAARTVEATFGDGVDLTVHHDTGPATLHLPSIHAEYVDWRLVVDKADRAGRAGSSGRVALGPASLAVIADLATDERPAQLTIAGPLDIIAARFDGAGLPGVRCWATPVRRTQ